ncbi:MAG: DUF2905 domain-containing protein [Candidatus Omnitrophica bacterium]|nr:DUF2905 domain-containing protein [Candidatus Omnitrophota bacterium]
MDLAKTLIVVGVICLVAGGILSLTGKLPWLGKLPGDFFIKKENFSFYFPLTTCILISLIFSFILWILKQK